MATALAIPSFDSQLAKTFRASRYAERMCGAHPELVTALRETGTQPLTAGKIRSLLGDPGEAAPNSNEEEAFHARLRAVRRQAMVTIIFRDINHLGDFAEVVDTVSALAAESLRAAQQFHTAVLAAKYALAELSRARAPDRIERR